MKVGCNLIKRTRCGNIYELAQTVKNGIFLDGREMRKGERFSAIAELPIGSVIETVYYHTFESIHEDPAVKIESTSASNRICKTTSEKVKRPVYLKEAIDEFAEYLNQAHISLNLRYKISTYLIIAEEASLGFPEEQDHDSYNYEISLRAAAAAALKIMHVNEDDSRDYLSTSSLLTEVDRVLYSGKNIAMSKFLEFDSLVIELDKIISFAQYAASYSVKKLVSKL